MLYKQALGRAIKEFRSDAGLTLRVAADRGYVSYSYLCEVESGHKTLSSELLEIIAEVLGVESYQLVKRTAEIMEQGWISIPDTIESLYGDFVH